jgi:hypothetical protein
MNNIGQDHRQRRNAGNGFEAHDRSRGPGEVRRGRGWRFMRDDFFFLEPHYRVTSRMAALPGKHVREAREIARLSHGK